jgi:hypothetical protein
MVRGSAGCLSTIASIAALGVCLVAFIGPVFAATLLDVSATIGKIVGLALGAAVCAACALVPLALVQDRVPRLGE